MVFRSTKTAFATAFSAVEANMGAGGDIPLSKHIQNMRTDRWGELLNYEVANKLCSGGVEAWDVCHSHAIKKRYGEMGRGDKG